MSYILDALKKAERERDAALVPTLTTVHDMPSSPANARIWIVFTICLACAAVLLWIGSLLLKPKVESASTFSGSWSTGEQAVATTPQFTVAGAAGGQSVPLEVPETEDLSASFPPNRSGALKPAQRPAKELSQASEEFSPPIASGKVSVTEVNETAPAPAAAPPKSLPLREAIAKMNMTVLFAPEAQMDRMVFIDAHRYVEGDYVDGIYLLESITPEGVWLSYRGERALLRAKPR